MSAYVSPVHGYRGFIRWVGGISMPFISFDFMNPENNLIPPLVTSEAWPTIWAPGLQIPVLTVVTHPMQQWWDEANFGTYFFRGTNNYLPPISTISVCDGMNEYWIYGAKGNSITISGIQGQLVEVTLNLMGTYASQAAPSTSPTGTITYPSRWMDCSFGNATAIARFTITFTNNLAPDVSFSDSRRPNGIDEHSQGCTLEITMKAAGSEISALNQPIKIFAGTKYIQFEFDTLKAATVSRCTWDETLYNYTYTCVGTQPFIVTYGVG